MVTRRVSLRRSLRRRGATRPKSRHATVGSRARRRRHRRNPCSVTPTERQPRETGRLVPQVAQTSAEDRVARGFRSRFQRLPAEGESLHQVFGRSSLRRTSSSRAAREEGRHPPRSRRPVSGFAEAQSAPVRKASRCMPWSVKPSWRCSVESLRRFQPKAKKPTLVGFWSLAHPGRFELPTLGFVVRCSIQLSYGCVGGECIARVLGTDRGKYRSLDRPTGGRLAVDVGEV
jgi:hypothetical protein